MTPECYDHHHIVIHAHSIGEHGNREAGRHSTEAVAKGLHLDPQVGDRERKREMGNGMGF